MPPITDSGLEKSSITNSLNCVNLATLDVNHCQICRRTQSPYLPYPFRFLRNDSVFYAVFSAIIRSIFSCTVSFIWCVYQSYAFTIRHVNALHSLVKLLRILFILLMTPVLVNPFLVPLNEW